MIVLIPDLRGQLVERLPRHVPVIGFQAIHPTHEFVPLVFRQRQQILFQFGQTHLALIILPGACEFKLQIEPVLGRFR